MLFLIELILTIHNVKFEILNKMVHKYSNCVKYLYQPPYGKIENFELAQTFVAYVTVLASRNVCNMNVTINDSKFGIRL